MQAPPLKTACDVMPHFVSSLNSIPSKPFNCTLSPPPCSQVNCNVSTGDVQQITHFPCTNPPSLRIIVRSPEDIVLTNITISESGPVSINFTNSTIETNFTIVQHTDYLTLGEAVSCCFLLMVPCMMRLLWSVLSGVDPKVFYFLDPSKITTLILDLSLYFELCRWALHFQTLAMQWCCLTLKFLWTEPNALEVCS